ncbi:MAG: hypothetical protein FWE87_02510 [Coriobacteriia bacterium]|nr:hypothetical protein [Coriobacteriia bacterium]
MAEHYCTLFDSNYLMQGLALIESIGAFDPDSYVWVLCLDERVLKAFDVLDVTRIKPVSLEAFETETLKQVRQKRTWTEYCWTLSAFFPEYVLSRGKDIERVTYIDADCYFFSTPQRILEPFQRSGASVLITPHAFDPRFDVSEKSGYFCVQFLTFNNDSPAHEILHWWQAHNIKSCDQDLDSDDFADQKCLDQWPALLGDDLFIVDDPLLTLAPWNVQYFFEALQATREPACLYHFHGFKMYGNSTTDLFYYEGIDQTIVKAFYEPYLARLRQVYQTLDGRGIEIAFRSPQSNLRRIITRAYSQIRGTLGTIRTDWKEYS